MRKRYIRHLNKVFSKFGVSTFLLVSMISSSLLPLHPPPFIEILKGGLLRLSSLKFSMGSHTSFIREVFFSLYFYSNKSQAHAIRETLTIFCVEFFFFFWFSKNFGASFQPYNRVINIKFLLHAALFCNINYFECLYENIYDYFCQRMERTI